MGHVELVGFGLGFPKFGIGILKLEIGYDFARVATGWLPRALSSNFGFVFSCLRVYGGASLWL